MNLLCVGITYSLLALPFLLPEEVRAVLMSAVLLLVQHCRSLAQCNRAVASHLS